MKRCIVLSNLDNFNFELPSFFLVLLYLCLLSSTNVIAPHCHFLTKSVNRNKLWDYLSGAWGKQHSWDLQGMSGAAHFCHHLPISHNNIQTWASNNLCYHPSQRNNTKLTFKIIALKIIFLFISSKRLFTFRNYNYFLTSINTTLM